MTEKDTASRLLDAAQTLVQRVGANAMSYQDLSAAVGITKASIHHHFPAKSDLLRALIDRYSDYFLGVVDQLLAQKISGAAKLARYCKLFEATLRESAGDRACPCGMLGAEVATLEPKAAGRLRHFYDENRKRLAAMLEEGSRDGSLKFPGNADTLAWTLFSLLEGAMLVARVDGGADGFRAMVAQFMKLVGARAGRSTG